MKNHKWVVDDSVLVFGIKKQICVKCSTYREWCSASVYRCWEYHIPRAVEGEDGETRLFWRTSWDRPDCVPWVKNDK